MAFLMSQRNNRRKIELTRTTPDLATGKPSRADILLKEATAQKQAGNINSAIETLKLAYKELEDSPSIYPIDTYLRLPLYLQQADRNDEAWGELNRLILWVNSKTRYSKELSPMDQSIIWDKMRLFLQREGKYDYAIQFAIWSYVSWGNGLYEQNRNDEFHTYKLKANIEKSLLPAVKKAGKQVYIEEIAKIVSKSLNSFPQLDYRELSESITTIIKPATNQLR